MTDTSAPATFTIGDVLSTSVAITLRKFLSFFAVTILFGIAAILLVGAVTVIFASQISAAGGFESFSPGPGGAVIVLLAVALGYALYFWLIGAVAYGVVQDLRGRPAGPLAMLGASLPRAHILIGAGILSYLAMGLGFMLLIIPGFIVAVGLAVVAPVAAVERLGVIGSMQRSWSLTSGYRWHIFGLFVLLYIILFVVSIVSGLISAGIGGALGDVAGGIVQLVIELVLQAAYVVLLVATAAVAYHTLRRVKDGSSADEIAAVFD